MKLPNVKGCIHKYFQGRGFKDLFDFLKTKELLDLDDPSVEAEFHKWLMDDTYDKKSLISLVLYGLLIE
jgi:hypothetical protein